MGQAKNRGTFVERDVFIQLTDKECDVHTRGNLVSRTQELLKRFETDEERLKFMEALSKGYCFHCGSFDEDTSDPDYRRCQCWNDE